MGELKEDNLNQLISDTVAAESVIMPDAGTVPGGATKTKATGLPTKSDDEGQDSQAKRKDTEDTGPGKPEAEKEAKNAETNEKNTEREKNPTGHETKESSRAGSLGRILDAIKKTGYGLALVVTFPVWGTAVAVRKVWDSLRGRNHRDPINMNIDQTTRYAGPAIKPHDQDHAAKQPELKTKEELRSKPNNPDRAVNAQTKKQENAEKITAPERSDPGISDKINETLKETFKKAYKEPQKLPLPDGSFLVFEAHSSKKEGLNFLKVTIEKDGKEPHLVYKKERTGYGTVKTGKYDEVKELVSMSINNPVREDPATSGIEKESDPEECTKIIDEAILTVQNTGITKTITIADGNKLEISPEKDKGYSIILRNADGEISILYAVSPDGPDGSLIPHGSVDNITKAVYPGILIEKTMVKDEEPDITVDAAQNSGQAGDPMTKAVAKAREGYKIKLAMQNGDTIFFEPVSAAFQSEHQAAVDIYVVDREGAFVGDLVKNTVETDDYGVPSIVNIKGSYEDVSERYNIGIFNDSLDDLISSSGIDNETEERAVHAEYAEELQEER